MKYTTYRLVHLLVLIVCSAVHSAWNEQCECAGVCLLRGTNCGAS